MVHSCIVFIELAPRRQQFHVAPTNVNNPDSAVSTPTSVDIQKRAVEPLFPESHEATAQWVCSESGE